MIRKWKRFDVKDVENLREELNRIGDYGITGNILYKVLSVIDNELIVINNELAEMREMIEELKLGGDKT